MVNIRNSPHIRNSPSKPQVQWPPASPFQALLSSPSGRKRWQDIQEQNRERSLSPSRRVRRIQSLEDNMSPGHAEADAEDEESLKLKLEILETKQKLRDLTKKREQQDLQTNIEQKVSWSPSKRRKLATNEGSMRGIQVPVSPGKPQITAQLPESPARVRLGIQDGRAEGVSLKRHSNAKPSTTSTERPVSSFSQRLANARSTTQEKQDNSNRLDSIRSKSFAQMQKKQTTTSSQASTRGLLDPRPALLEARTQAVPSKTGNSKARANSRNPEYYDPFSEIHLSSRNMSHTDVARSLTGCEIYTIPRLLKEVKSPEYEPPDCESDYVVFGILAEKTSPFKQKETNRVVDRHEADDQTRVAKNKFMVLRLCDLQWEIDCYLFGTGFEQYWKLTEGTLLAILNPAIMPPRTNQHNGRFSLKIASSEDRIIELGVARDLGYCTSTKKDGKKCSAWVNKQKSEHCEFHVNLMIGRARKGRMEVNTMWHGLGPEEKKPKEKRNPNVSNHFEYGQLWSVGGVHGRSAAKLLDDDDSDRLHNLTKEEASRKRIAAQQRERDLAARLGATGGGVAGDYLRARHGIASSSNETPSEPMFVKPTAAELGLLSRKADAQRLSPAKDRRRHFGIGAISSAGTEAMGWGGARKSDLLKPKENRLGSPERGQTKLDTRARSALQSPSQARSLSPKKKARFMLEKGVREPGRDSGVHELLQSRMNHDDNDDDDLDIV